MKFLALLVALACERLWSSKLHVREPAWLVAQVLVEAGQARAMYARDVTPRIGAE